MGKTEVTVGEFRRFVDASGYKTEADTSGGGYEWTGSKWEEKVDANWKSSSQGEDNPVVQVSWNDGVHYCNWLSTAEGLIPAYTVKRGSVTCDWRANGYRLPTEAEWEYACRAGTETPFNTGSNITTNQANYNGSYPYNNNTKGTYRKKTTAVGSFAPNQWGLYDMHGNVFEWCWDWYGEYPTGAQTDPQGALSGSDRVIRGGCWYNYARYLRSAVRGSEIPSFRNIFMGFRLACSSSVR
jgi:formylglycine-generating enzyme required for sulfatase activity